MDEDLDIDIVPLEYMKLIKQSLSLSHQQAVRQKALELAKSLMIKHLALASTLQPYDYASEDSQHQHSLNHKLRHWLFNLLKLAYQI